ncbi:recombinase RecT [Escherichia coli]|uniref:recombinase RecT n=1 Tax=Escherichia coli TaxID=562 RepID=UPI00192E16A8|nr:recombinase RecT [Escherichia coli]ELM7716938.1 recombinase RecT [Escherichia coli]ELM7755579.1 recombinase RecT [Escherichia coli]ELM7802093.1 recombinase RecT [Escherichia coli]ELM7819284.1 recombinase RecT [Escherichia coli]ELM7838623.1 recombinase RecT [Escherichia coli]
MSTALATLAGKLAERVGMDSVDPQELITTLRQTAFKGDASDAQFIALLIVANQYGLNPWTKEIYAFPDNDETMQEINTLLIALDKTWDDDLLPLCSQIFRRDIRASSELTQAEAVKALGFLKQKATEQKVAA